MLTYKCYTTDASKMDEKLSSAVHEMARLSEELSNVEAGLLSMVHILHILSTPDTVVAMNDFLVREYNPLLSKQMHLSSKMVAQSRTIEHMKQAMLEPGYIADREIHVARHLEDSRVEAEMRSEMDLIESVRMTLDKDEIKKKLERESSLVMKDRTRVEVCASKLTERSPFINEGDVAWVTVYTGGRSHAVLFANPCVVVRRVLRQDAGFQCVVCEFNSYNHDGLECRIVDEDCLYGRPPNEDPKK